ncbi:MAG TPA: hypothetical protein VEL74_11945 [Thermoanaerobaculia bacterium]|nr:hypothetical protein [Thermoanaerobaculia bacterium]
MNTTQREVNVKFRDNRVSFSGSGISQDGRILIPTESGLIVLRLKTSRVRFPSFPIQWTIQQSAAPPATGTEFAPIAQPSEATVIRKSDRESDIRIVSPEGTREFSFFVLVETPDGKFFGTDPTIVTMRPPDPNDAR